MGLKNVSIKNEYRTFIDDVAKDFYIPLLREAVLYQRAVGFFSSSALAIITKGIEGLVQNGGKIQVITSPKLSASDIEEIGKGYEIRKVIEKALIRELDSGDTQTKLEELSFIARLVADGILDIKIAFLTTGNEIAMYHEKMGLITDTESNTVAFSGSMNESENALSGNYEVFDTFRSWTTDFERVFQKKKAFKVIWEGDEVGVETLEFPVAVKKRLYEYNPVLRKRNEPSTSNNIEKMHCAEEKSAIYLPSDFEIRDYQKKAIENWENNNYCGIYDMATGTGKTLTALASIEYLFKKNNSRLAIVIVCPYQHLVEQWVEDIVRFGIQPIIGYSASPQKNWRKLLDDAVRDQKLKVKNRDFFTFIATNATFASEYVQQQISKARGDILLVVDEAHNFGSERLIKVLDERFKYRLALSATLERHNDEEGTAALYNYFGNKCIEYTLERAIKEGKLTNYKYYPKIVTLTEDERDLYEKISRQLQRCLIKTKSGKLKLNENGQKLALKRAKIVAGALNKINLLRQEILPYINDNHILVYCGTANVLRQEQEFTSVDNYDIRQIDLVTDLLGNELDMKVSQFTSKEDVAERKILKEEFEIGENLQALIAIKCLDEGVNIPKIKVAFILASTTNPKEYIQRRGRVLRLSVGKEFAEIYDFITLPRALDEVPSLTKEQMERELSLVKNELCRVEEFAKIAMNGIESELIMEEIKEAYNLRNYVLEYKEDYFYDE